MSNTKTLGYEDPEDAVPGFWFFQYEELDRDCDGTYPIDPPVIAWGEHLDDAINNADAVFEAPDGCTAYGTLVERRATKDEIVAHLATPVPVTDEMVSLTEAQAAIKYVIDEVAGGFNWENPEAMMEKLGAIRFLANSSFFPVTAALGTPVPEDETPDGAALVAAERRRQVSEEGYSAEGDRGRAGDLACAGSAYAYGRGYSLKFPDSMGGRHYLDSVPAGLWPFSWEYWKPTDSPVRDLVKAGALIVAAIDTLLEGQES